MKTLRKAIAVIGEGITEKYYIESLRALAGNDFQILPQQLGVKASNLNELEKAIEKAINEGRDEVYCLIDMDNKGGLTEKTKYEKLKTKYHDKHFIKKSKGIDCYVHFIENKRCMEVWFIYYFDYLTRHFGSYAEAENYLHKYVPDYQKHENFFRSKGSLHKKLKAQGGNLETAVTNAQHSLQNRDNTDSDDVSYSEMCHFMQALNIKE